jgi:hypothetical protein
MLTGAFGCLGDPPATRVAGEAALLLLRRFGWRIHQAENLIHWLARIWVALREPALAIVGAALPMSAPVQALAWVFFHAKVHDCTSPSARIERHQRSRSAGSLVLVRSNYTWLRRVSQGYRTCCNPLAFHPRPCQR